jgi:hypothetical protein
VVSTFSWNLRYFVFFLPAFWVLAAEAIADIGQRLRGAAAGVWYACVLLLLLPNLLSHFADGSRHDYRQAAEVVGNAARPGELILSDDSETLTYYLRDDLRPRLLMRTRVPAPPASSFLLVARSNAWTPPPRFRDRWVEPLAQIGVRRIDQFSHILRVYRVH